MRAFSGRDYSSRPTYNRRRIRELLWERGYTQREFAEAIGYSLGHVERALAGHTRISDRFAYLTSLVLEVPLDEIQKDDPHAAD